MKIHNFSQKNLRITKVFSLTNMANIKVNANTQTLLGSYFGILHHFPNSRSFSQQEILSATENSIDLKKNIKIQCGPIMPSVSSFIIDSPFPNPNSLIPSKFLLKSNICKKLFISHPIIKNTKSAPSLFIDTIKQSNTTRSNFIHKSKILLRNTLKKSISTYKLRQMPSKKTLILPVDDILRKAITENGDAKTEKIHLAQIVKKRIKPVNLITKKKLSSETRFYIS